ncbi:MAG TPA: hypothetical protein VK540_26100 [Polyangiaceae bacterium]|nr:hypothetical protein [Polyangiaceae bacterium]
MGTHSQALVSIAEQLEQQNTAWQGIRNFMEKLDARTLLAVDESLLADIETVCTNRFSPPSGAPPRGLRG